MRAEGVSLAHTERQGVRTLSKKTKDTEYLTISAMLRAREASMLSREKMDRMLAAASYAEAAKLLAEVRL